MAHVADGAHGDGWARSARLAFEKSPRRPAGRSPRPNLPYTRANKRLHLALKKHAEGERVTRPWHEAEDRGGGGNPQGDGDGLKEVEERCSPMPVTLISAAGHAALFHYCTTMLVPGKQVGWLDEEDGARRRMERKGVDGSVDRSGWCIGTNAFAVKTGDARGNGVFLQQQPCEGRVNLSERKRYRRGLNRFAWTRAVHRRFMSFPETSVPNVNDFYFSFSVSPPFRLFSPRAPVRGRMDPWQTFPRRETFLRTRGTGRKVIDDSNRFIDLLLSPGKEKEIGGIYIFLHSIPSVIVGERRNVLE